jgi:antitoxin VapB
MYIRHVYTNVRAMKTTKTFKSGNSIAVRLPKALGIGAGVEMRVREDQGKYVLEPVAPPPKRIDLTSIAGSVPGLKPVKRLNMAARDLDWDGKLLERG